MVFEAGSIIRYLGFYYTNLNARKLPTLRYCVGYAAILFQIEAKCVVLIKKPQFLNVVSVRKTFDRHSYLVEPLGRTEYFFLSNVNGYKRFTSV